MCIWPSASEFSSRIRDWNKVPGSHGNVDAAPSAIWVEGRGLLREARAKERKEWWFGFGQRC